MQHLKRATLPRLTGQPTHCIAVAGGSPVRRRGGLGCRADPHNLFIREVGDKYRFHVLGLPVEKPVPPLYPIPQSVPTVADPTQTEGPTAPSAPPLCEEWLFCTAGSHGSQGPELRTPDAVLNGSCTLL